MFSMTSVYLQWIFDCWITQLGLAAMKAYIPELNRTNHSQICVLAHYIEYSAIWFPIRTISLNVYLFAGDQGFVEIRVWSKFSMCCIVQVWIPIVAIQLRISYWMGAIDKTLIYHHSLCLIENTNIYIWLEQQIFSVWLIVLGECCNGML